MRDVIWSKTYFVGRERSPKFCLTIKFPPKVKINFYSLSISLIVRFPNHAYQMYCVHSKQESSAPGVCEIFENYGVDELHRGLPEWYNVLKRVGELPDLLMPVILSLIYSIGRCGASVVVADDFIHIHHLFDCSVSEQSRLELVLTV